MVLLRWTQKLLERLEQVDDLAPVESTTRLGDSYGNILRIGQRQMLSVITLPRSSPTVRRVNAPPTSTWPSV